MKEKNIYIFLIVLIFGILTVEPSIIKYNGETNINIEKISNQVIAKKVEPKEYYVNLNLNNETVKLELEDYITGVVSCELPASFDVEALKAGAVAARTYAMEKIINNKNYVLYSTTMDQCYMTKEALKTRWGSSFDKYYDKIKNAVKDTKNEVVTYNGDVIKAFYFSMSNGKTENVESVFMQKLDYLRSVDSSFDKNINGYETTIKISKKEFLNTLGINGNDINIEKITRNNRGYVENIKVNNKDFKGTRFQYLLGLRSADFDIKINEYVYITTRGYGHAVGMSQYGANELAKRGYNYDEILKYYYQNTKIEKLSV